MFTIYELSNNTGLKVDFIRKCLKSLKPFFDSYLVRGDNNSILFDSNSLVIFDKIKQLKEEGLAIPEIKIKLDQAFQGDQPDIIKPIKTDIKSDQSLHNFQVKIYELYEQISEEKEKRIKESNEKNDIISRLEKEKTHLESTIKLLPESKSPEQIKDDYEKNQKRKREIAKLIGELKSIGTFRFIKRKKLIKQLEELTDF